MSATLDFMRPLLRRYTPYILELLAIALLLLVFVSLWASPPTNVDSGGLNPAALTTALFDPSSRPNGLEYERLAGVLYPVKIGLESYGHIPTWNPYLGSGQPFFNDAFNYLFNPFHSLPVLLADSVVQGTKLATVIALLLASLNMWALALAVGLGTVGRLLAGVLYMTSGGIAAKFYAGHYQLALSLAWPPLVLAALWWTLRSRNRFAPVAFGFAFALLFFAGNIYYVLHTLLCCAFIILIHLFERKPASTAETQYNLLNTQHFFFRLDRLRRTAVALLFAFGLTAVQFFPIWLTRDYVIHDNQAFNANGSLDGSYPMSQVLTNLTYPWPEWNFSSSFGLTAAVDYAYIGPTVFLLLVLALITYLASRPTAMQATVGDEPIPTSAWYALIACIALILALLMMIWGTGQTAPLEWLYHNLPLLAEFRFVGRALSIAALWWILLGAVGADILWKKASGAFRSDIQLARQNHLHLLAAIGLGSVAWLYYLIYSLSLTSARLPMVLYNYSLLNAFDSRRFTSFQEAASTLWLFLLTSILLDIIRVMIGGLLHHWRGRDTVDWRTIRGRILQWGILAVVFLAISDSISVNSQLYRFEPNFADFSVLYPAIRASDPHTPFPSVNQPYAPSAFSGYEGEIRNWGVDEGWRPGALPGIIAWGAGELPDLPRWAIVSSIYGGTSLELSQQFVAANGYIKRECAFLYAHQDTDDPCNLASLTTAVLYEKPDVLPYTFVAPSTTLTTAPATLNATNVYAAQLLSHEIDRITIEAATPAEGEFFLIVQETNFPGWQVTIDGQPAAVTTAETYHDLKGNRGFIAVAMPPGRHIYELYFDPPGFTLGFVISLLTLLGIGIYLWKSRKKV